jgi:hypothetical protein
MHMVRQTTINASRNIGLKLLPSQSIDTGHGERINYDHFVSVMPQKVSMNSPSILFPAFLKTQIEPLN